MVKFCPECGKDNLYNNPGNKDPLKEGDILINRYSVIKLIKSGGMGAIYKALDGHLARDCAIKELITYWCISESEEEYVIKRFRNEAKLLAGLNHGSLPGITDFFIIDERYYIVMDFVEGVDLETIIVEEGKPGLPPDRVINWGIELCDVLDYIHSEDPPIIYRDIKPSNIMLRTKDNKLILIDFGIAYAMEKEISGVPRTMIGTMGYIAPEQYMGKPVKASDVYSLGATLYHLLTGQMPIPFRYKSILEIIPDFSLYIDNVIRKSLELTPENRFQNAFELKEALLGISGQNKDRGHDMDISYRTLLLKNEKLEEDLKEAGRQYEKADRKYKTLVLKNKKLEEDLKKSGEQVNLLEKKLRKILPDNPFPGNFSSFNPVRLIKYIEKANLTGLITFYCGKIKGNINVEDGKIIYINYNQWLGELAFSKFLELEQGDFDLNENRKLQNSLRRSHDIDLKELMPENKKEELLTLEKIVDTLISPDISLIIQEKNLQSHKNIKLTRYHMKLMALISNGTNNINKLADNLNSYQIKISEAIYYLKERGLVKLELQK